MTKKQTITPYIKSICGILYTGHTPRTGGRVIEPNKHFSIKSYTTFARYLSTIGKKERTIKAYLYFLHKFNADVTEYTISHFEQHIAIPFDFKPSTKTTVIRRNYKVMRVLALYLLSINKRNWIELMTPYSNPKANCHDKTFSELRLKKLIAAAPDIQTKLYMKVAYYSGMRRQEMLLIEAHRKHINREKKCIVISEDISKSSKRGIVWIPAYLFDELCDYIDNKYELRKGLKEQEHNYVFEFLERDKYSEKTLDILEKEEIILSKLIKEISEKSGIMLDERKDKSITPHCFKHCYAKYIERKGFPMRIRKELMRLSSSELVDRYTMAGEREVEAMWKKKDVEMA